METQRKPEESVINRDYDSMHLFDWPIVVYNGLSQNIDYRQDDPRRQDYCPWCRGFGSAHYYEPDPCPGCRGTGVVSPLQQEYLFHRFYARLEDEIYPDWPCWHKDNMPIFPPKEGQWNDFDTVMSYRARLAEIKWDEARRKKFPQRASRIQYPPPRVEQMMRAMKTSRRHFPIKPAELIRVSTVRPKTEPPVFNPTRYKISSRDIIGKMGLKMYKLEEKWKPWQKSDSPEEFYVSKLQLGESDSGYSGEIKRLKMEKLRMEADLKTERKVRGEIMMKLDELSGKELMEEDGKLIKCQEKIMKLEMKLNGVEEDLAKLMSLNSGAKVVTLAKIGNGDLRRVGDVNRKIEFEQTRKLYVKRGARDGEWVVLSKGITLKAMNGELLTDAEFMLGMTLAQDTAFFPENKKEVSPRVIKIVSHI